MLDDKVRTRLRRAGNRFHAADAERRSALAELKSAVVQADGDCSGAEAQELTGLPAEMLHSFSLELREPSE